MSVEYHLWLNDEVKGPYTLGQLTGMWQTGQLTGENLFSTGGPEWKPLKELAFLLEPDPAPVRLAQPTSEPSIIQEKKSGKKGILILIIILLIGGVGFFLLQPASITKTENGPIAPPAIPTEIRLALNNVDSATTTGINRADYTSLVIALKSATSTYGQNLSSDQSLKLNSIVANYDLVAKLWALSYENGSYGQCIAIGGDFLNQHYDLTSALNDLDIKPDDQTHLYFTNSILSKIWQINGDKIKTLQ